MKRKKNKILFYMPGLYPCKTGGMEIYNYYLLKNLLKYFPEMKFKVLTDCKSLTEKYNNFYPLKNRLFGVRRWGLGTLSTIIYYFFSNKIHWRDVNTIFISYTDNFKYNAIWFLVLKKIYNVNYNIYIHDGGLKIQRNNYLLKLFFKNASNIAGVSKIITEKYDEIFERDVKYLPPLVPFNKPTKEINSLKEELSLLKFDTIILFVGSLKELKKPYVLLNAFIQLGCTFIESNNIGLLFIGEGNLKSELKNSIYKSGLYKNILLLGHIANIDINQYYSISDIFVIPSEYEGTPIVLLEAMFNGMICIGSDADSIKRIITHKSNGFIFKRNSEKELCDLLKEIINTLNQYNNIKQNAMKYFEYNFNYQNYLKKITDFIFK